MKGIENFSAETTLKDGRRVLIRAIRPEDREMLRVAFNKLDPRTVFMRFFGRKGTLTDRELTEFTEVDFEHTVALVVTLHEGEGEEMIAAGRYIRLNDVTPNGSAEVAFTVRDNVQRQGLASQILSCLVQIARGRGIGLFEAEVLPQNVAMLSVFHKSGLAMERRYRDGIVHVTLDLSSEE